MERSVMERRNLIVGLLVLVVSVFMLAGTASAHKGKANPATVEPKGCVIETLPSFVDQGEFEEHSSVADVIQVECEGSGKLQYDGKIKISDVELYDRCGKKMSWTPTDEFLATEGPSTEATLDDDGNATVVLFAGPGCKPGESQIAVDEIEYPNETYTAPFTVTPPEETEEGVFAMPSHQVEDDITSSVGTIIQVEFPGIAEAKVTINAEQLALDCGKAPKTIWIGPNEKEITPEVPGRLEGETAPVTDNDGNAFVVLLGATSCGPGKVHIEASLEEVESFNTVNGLFVVEAPKPTI